MDIFEFPKQNAVKNLKNESNQTKNIEKNATKEQMGLKVFREAKKCFPTLKYVNLTCGCFW